MNESDNTSPFSASIHTKDGVDVSEYDATWADVGQVINEWIDDWMVGDYNATITSGNEAPESHSPTSLHNKCDAIDLRIRDISFDAYDFRPFGRAWKEALKAAAIDLARRLWYIRIDDIDGIAQVPVLVLEKDHIHLQAGFENIIKHNTKINFYISNKFKQLKPIMEQ